MEENISQDSISGVSPRVLQLLLQDKATGKNIVWATDNYISRGEEYAASCEIFPELITGPNTRIIQPRVHKSREDQSDRTRKRGEVYTPFFICKKMCNHAHKALCGEGDWKHYVDARVLELTCGEAPFLVSPYDAATGEAIPLEQRAGLLDRKLRKVNDNAQTEEEWLTWAFRAVQSTYGYEYQGDSLLLARLNILHTFRDYLAARWEREPALNELLKVANIISWNLWQMDGLKNTTPIGSLESKNYIQLTLFGDEDPDPGGPIARRCVVYNWRAKKSQPVAQDFLEGVKPMKFDFVIGNPPYQEEIEGTSDKPIYNDFMDAAYTVSDKVELITPARFLFNAGKTPKAWNQKMLSDPHLKVLYYEQDSSKVFPNTGIKGGVTITCRDLQKNCGAIEVFTSFDELRSIKAKVQPFLESGSITDIMLLQNRFNLDALYCDFPECSALISSDGKERRIVSSSFEKLPVFNLEKVDDTDIQILGVVGANKRQYRWINPKYVEDNGNLWKWKVFVPKSNGSGAIGEVLSTPLIGQPLIGLTQSFISIGAFETEQEASAALKYIKSKFARTLLGILKITQDNPPEKWKYVPLQDFTPASDIDWTKSIPEIDQQLYKKYGLSQEEIDFIESHVKEME